MQDNNDFNIPNPIGNSFTSVRKGKNKIVLKPIAKTSSLMRKC